MHRLLAARWRLLAALSFVALIVLAHTGVSGPSVEPVSANPLTGMASVSAGRSHTCSVSTDGVVKCWGENSAGQLGLGDETAPSAVPREVQGLPAVDQVSAGHQHTCALTVGGGVKCWGDNSRGQLGDGGSPGGSAPVDVVGLSSGVVTLASDGSHTCAIMSTGAVECWGSNEFGQLGAETSEDCAPGEVFHPCSTTPVEVAGLAAGAADLATGVRHTCAAMASGGAKCWGYNFFGQLGDGTFFDRDTPVDVAGLNGAVAAVSAGFGHSCALTADDGLMCWGGNFAGQLGDGTHLDRTEAVQVSGMTSGVQTVGVGDLHSCAVLLTGTVKCWGLGLFGQLGTETPESTLPLDVPGVNNAAAITGGEFHTCALVSTGTVKCWGLSSSGQLGDGTGLLSSARPVPVLPLGSTTAHIGAGGLPFGGTFNCVVTTTGGARCWGENDWGQLGNGGFGGGTNPTDVIGLASGLAELSTSGASSHTCALTAAGALKCWGRNGSGQLGNNTDSGPQICGLPSEGCSSTPVDVIGLQTEVLAVATGGGHTCAVTTGGGAKCWGANDGGQVGDGTTVKRLTPANVAALATGVASISAGAAHSCAMTTGSGVKCWGDNSLGQLGDGTTSGRTTPVDVSGLSSGVAAVAAGPNHTCALTTTGGVKCWGLNGSGQLGAETTDLCSVPSGTFPCSTTPLDVVGLTSGVAALTAGSSHTCALTTTGGVKCWGGNLSGQLGDGSFGASTVPVNVVGLGELQSEVSAGGTQTCAVSVSGAVTCWGGQAGLESVCCQVVTVIDASAKPTPTFTPCAPEGCPTATPTPTPPLAGPKPEMRLVVVDQPDACAGGVCQVGLLTEFTLGVEIVAAPHQGYIEAASYIFYGPNLTYDPSALRARDEVVWPDCASSTALRAQVDNTLPPVSGGNNTDEAVNHGCLTSLFPPLPVSMYVGMLVEISLTCSAEPTRNLIELLPIVLVGPATPIPVTRASTSGAKFKFVDPTDIFRRNVTISPKVSGLTIDCVEPAAVGGVALDGELAPLHALEAAEQRSRDLGFWIAGALVALVGFVVVSAIVCSRLRSRLQRAVR